MRVKCCFVGVGQVRVGAGGPGRDICVLTGGCLWEGGCWGDLEDRCACFRAGACGKDLAGGTRKIDVYVFGQVASLGPHFRHLEWLPPSRCRRLHWRAEPSLTPAHRSAGPGFCPYIFWEIYDFLGQKPEPAERCSGSLGARQAVASGSTGLAEVGGCRNKRHCLRQSTAFMGGALSLPQRMFCQRPCARGHRGRGGKAKTGKRNRYEEGRKCMKKQNNT